MSDDIVGFEPAPGWDPSTDPVLEIENLRLDFWVYEGRAEVIDDVSISIGRGETVGLVGESGCGKSVTSRAILGILDANAVIDTGEIRYKGRNLLEVPQAELARFRGSEIALIPQDPMSSLNPTFTVADQLIDLSYSQRNPTAGLAQYLLDKYVRKREERSTLREKAASLLEQLDIDDPTRVLESYPLELSGGMRQRVLIASALMGDPDFIIADEIGTALDVTVEDRMLQLLEDRMDQLGMSVLYVTHDLGVIRDVAQRIYVMYAGQVMESAPTEQLFQSPEHPYTAGLIGAVPKLAGEKPRGIEGMLPEYVEPPKGCRFHTRCPFAMSHCVRERPVLTNNDPETPAHRTACHLYDARFGDDTPTDWRTDLDDIVGRPQSPDDRNAGPPMEEPE